MIPFGFFTRTAPAPAPVVHIHQGGTANAYCGEVLTAPGAVDWTQAEEATCSPCHNAFFPAQWAAEDSARAARYHGSNAFGR